MFGKDHWAGDYRVHKPCPEAWKDVLHAPSLQFWWDNCQRGDWMLWAISRSPEMYSRQLAQINRVASTIQREIVDPWFMKFGGEYADKRSAECMSSLLTWCRNPNTDNAIVWHDKRTHARNVLRESGNQKYDASSWEASGDETMMRIAQIVRREIPYLSLSGSH